MGIFLLVTLFLISSCKCFKIKNDVRRVWSLRFNQCRCQTYSFKKVESLDKLIACEDYFIPLREDYEKKCREDDYAEDHPERCYILPNNEYCDDLVGFSKESWGLNITPRARETKACIEDDANCKGN